MQDSCKLVVWEKSHSFVLQVYRLTRQFPPDERFGLTSQLRRAAASIPANLAEACGRAGRQEFGRFAQIAMGSAAESEYHILLAKDLGYLGDGDYDIALRAIQEAKRMLASLLKTVRKPIDDQPGSRPDTDN